MGEQQMEHAGLARPRRHQAIAGRPRRRLYAGDGLGAPPFKHVVGDAACLQPAAHLARFVGGLGP